jgi:hypothetical protein
MPAIGECLGLGVTVFAKLDAANTIQSIELLEACPINGGSLVQLALDLIDQSIE